MAGKKDKTAYTKKNISQNPTCIPTKPHAKPTQDPRTRNNTPEPIPVLDHNTLSDVKKINAELQAYLDASNPESSP